MKTNRKRNVARKSKRAARTTNPGFVPQNAAPANRQPENAAPSPASAPSPESAPFPEPAAAPSLLQPQKTEETVRSVRSDSANGATESCCHGQSESASVARGNAPSDLQAPKAAAEASPSNIAPEAAQASAPNASAANTSPEAGHPEPEAGIGWISQNRANAAHSTGPRTAEGKAASSQNAFKHGLSIQRHAVLRDEDPAQYAQLLAELREIYEPRSRREDLAVEDIAQCRWALQRFDEAEATALNKLTFWHNDPSDGSGFDEPISTGAGLGYSATVLTDSDERGRRFVEPDTHYPTFEKIHRYRTHWERKHARALAEFDRAQRSRRSEERQQFARDAAFQRAERHGQQSELNELRLALARQKLERERAKHANAADDAAFQAFESLVNAPTPMTEEDFLRQSGFVSQNGAANAQTPHPQAA